MNQLAVKTQHRGGRALPAALALVLFGTAVVAVARPLDASAASVGISYVANPIVNSVTEYAAGADGNATPVRTISGSSTGLNQPSGVALDSAGTLYVANAGTATVRSERAVR